MIRRQFALMAVVSLMFSSSGQLAAQPPAATASGVGSLLSGADGSVYLVHSKALFKRASSGGDVWTKLAQDVKTAAADPSNASILYIVQPNLNNSIRKTLDGGKTWVRLAGLAPGEVHSVTAGKSVVFAATASGLQRSDDGGFTWRASGLEGDVTRVTPDPSSSTTFYANGPSLLAVSTDEGKSWSRIEARLPRVTVRGQARTASTRAPIMTFLVPLGTKPTSLFLVTNDFGLVTSSDGGTTWAREAGQLENAKLYSGISLGDEIVLGGDGAVYRRKAGSPWRREAVAGVLSRFGAIGGVLPDATGGLLVAETDDPNTSDPNTSEGKLALLRATGSLVPLNYALLPHSSVLTIDRSIDDRRERLIAVVRNEDDLDVQKRRGIIVASDDGGATWDTIVLRPNTEKMKMYVNAITQARLYVSPKNPKEIWLFVNCCTNFQAWAMLYSLDAGNTWKEAEVVNPIAIEFDRADSSTKYIVNGVNEGYLSRCKLDATTPAPLCTQLNVPADYSLRGVVVDSENPKRLLTSSFQLSEDAGWTWRDVSAGIERTLSGMYRRSEGLKRSNPAVLRFQSNEILLVMKPSVDIFNNKHDLVLRSSDLGGSWSVLKDFGQREFGGFFDVRISAAGSEALAAIQPTKSTPGPIVNLSTDAGRTWTEVWRPTGNAEVYQVAVTKGGPNPTVFVATSQGLLRQEAGGAWDRLGGVR